MAPVPQRVVGANWNCTAQQATYTQPACFPQVLIYEQPENLGHLSSSNFLPKQVTSQTQCLPHSDQSMCLLWLICSPAGSLLLCAGLASIEHTSKPLLKILRKLFPWILPPFSTFLLPGNIESGKHSTYKSRLWSSIPGMFWDTLPPRGIWGCFQAALLSHTQLAWGRLFIVTGSSTNIHDLLPQIFVSHESREPLNFTRVVTSQTKAINKVWNLQYPPRGMEKEISAGRKDQVLLQWQMVLHKRSTLGSFCCSLFINNLSDIGITARVQRYADNKTLFYSPRSPAGTAKSLQSDFSVAGHFWRCLSQESTASLQSKDEMEKFHGSPAWPLIYPDFSPPFPTSHPEQDSQSHVCHSLHWL